MFEEKPGKEAIAEELRFIKKILDLSWQEMASVFGTDEKMLARWRQGESNPPEEIARKIHNIFDLVNCAVDLFTEEGARKFFYTYNDNFKDKPVNLVKRGEVEELHRRLVAIIEFIPL